MGLVLSLHTQPPVMGCHFFLWLEGMVNTAGSWGQTEHMHAHEASALAHYLRRWLGLRLPPPQQWWVWQAGRGAFPLAGTQYWLDLNNP